MKPTDPISIAILRTDEVQPQFIGRHGDYPDMFERLLVAAAADSRPHLRLRLESFDARQGDHPAPDAFDGYLITGSRNSVYDDEPWIAALASHLQDVLAGGAAILGICFGHQLLAHFFGGRTEAAAGGWAVGVQESRMLSEEPWMVPAGSRLNLLSSHKDQVTKLPPDARRIAASDFCPVGGFVIGEQVLTFQGHPEFAREYSRDLMDMRRELLGEPTYQRGVASLAKETDEHRVGQWMLNFVVRARSLRGSRPAKDTTRAG